MYKTHKKVFESLGILRIELSQKKCIIINVNKRNTKPQRKEVKKMTKTEFKNHMAIWGNANYENTCPALQAEIIRKIMNCKAIDDFEKMAMLKQYINNLSTNNHITEAIKQYNK